MIKFIVYPLLLIVLFVVYVKYIESKSIFFPTKNIDLTPQDLQIPFEDIYIKAGGSNQINGWFIPFENAKYTILFCHGNGGNISHRMEKITILRRSKANIFIFDYEGYGKSQGKPSEKGIYQDAQASFDYLVEMRKIDPKGIIVYGESLGCAVAIDLAWKNTIGGLILEGSFSSGKDMARIIYPFLPTALFFNKFNSIEKIKDIDAPKLFIHSKSDEIVPYSLAQKLFDAAREPKNFVSIRGGHNTAFIDSQQEYAETISVFIEKSK